MGKADVKREGTDVSIVTYGAMVHKALEAAENLAAQGHRRRGRRPAIDRAPRRGDGAALDREDLARAGALRVAPVPGGRGRGRRHDRRAGLRAPRRAGRCGWRHRTCRSRSRPRSRTRSSRRCPTSRRRSTASPHGESREAMTVTSIQMPQLGETIVEGTILKWLKQEGEHDRRRRAAVRDLDRQGRHRSAVARRGDRHEDPGRRGRDRGRRDRARPRSTPVTERPSGDGDAVRARRRRTIPRGAGAASPADARRRRRAAAPAPPLPPPLRRHRPLPPRRTPPPPPLRRLRRCRIGGRGRRSFAVGAEAGGRSTRSICAIAGSGTGGRITKQDVMEAVAAGGTSAPAAAPSPAAAPPRRRRRRALRSAAPAVAGGGEEVVPISHIRKAIAAHMVASLQTTARAWTMVEVNMEHIVRLRERVKDAFAAREGFNLTYMPFVTRATTEALLAFPMVNAELRGEDIVVRHYVNMGIAVSLRRGPDRSGREGRRHDEPRRPRPRDRRPRHPRARASS